MCRSTCFESRGAGADLPIPSNECQRSYGKSVEALGDAQVCTCDVQSAADFISESLSLDRLQY